MKFTKLAGVLAAALILAAPAFAGPPLVTSLSPTNDLVPVIPGGVGTAQSVFATVQTLLTGAAYSSTSATPGTVRDITGKISVGAGITMTSGNLVGARGEVNLPSGTAISGGYIYGAQGKFIGGGTTSSSANAAGLVGQTDVSTGTYTAGVISAGWFDMGATASSSAVSTDIGGRSQVVRMTNTTGAKATAVVDLEANAEAMFSVETVGGGLDAWHSATCTPGTVTGGTGGLKITIDGVTKWIPLAATCS